MCVQEHARACVYIHHSIMLSILHIICIFFWLFLCLRQGLMVAQAGLELAVYLRMNLNSCWECNSMPSCLAHKWFVLPCMLKNTKCHYLSFLWGLVRSPEKSLPTFWLVVKARLPESSNHVGKRLELAVAWCMPALHAAWNLPPSFSGGPAVPRASNLFHLPIYRINLQSLGRVTA